MGNTSTGSSPASMLGDGRNLQIYPERLFAHTDPQTVDCSWVLEDISLRPRRERPFYKIVSSLISWRSGLPLCWMKCCWNANPPDGGHWPADLCPGGQLPPPTCPLAALPLGSSSSPSTGQGGPVPVPWLSPPQRGERPVLGGPEPHPASCLLFFC